MTQQVSLWRILNNAGLHCVGVSIVFSIIFLIFLNYIYDIV